MNQTYGRLTVKDAPADLYAEERRGADPNTLFLIVTNEEGKVVADVINVRGWPPSIHFIDYWLDFADLQAFFAELAPFFAELAPFFAELAPFFAERESVTRRRA